MLKRISIIFLIAIVLTSCLKTIKATSYYILSDTPYIQEFEKLDHQFCNNLNLNFKDEFDDNKETQYWRCRLSTAKYRLKTDISDQQSLAFNKDISDLVARISIKLTLSPQAMLEIASEETEKLDHKKCLEMGFVFETDDQATIDEYFACRKILIEERFAIPPFRKADYLGFEYSIYNSGFAIDQRIDEKIKKFKKAEEQYPACVRFKIDSDEFKICTIAFDEKDQCMSKVNKKKFRKEVEKKIICQKQAFIRFPDSMVKDDDNYLKKLQETNQMSDYYNNNDFGALGIGDLSQFEAKSSSQEAQATQENIKKIKNQKLINSKEQLYARYELTKLREKYINICQEHTNLEISEYQESLIKECLAIIKSY